MKRFLVAIVAWCIYFVGISSYLDRALIPLDYIVFGSLTIMMICVSVVPLLFEQYKRK